MPLFENWKRRVGQLKVDVYALYLAYKCAETPWYAKAFTACVVGYAVSPIDLIPDFIPVLGLLDDLVIVPLGIAAAIKMIPRPVMERCRAQARESLSRNKPKNWLGIAIIVAIWLIVLAVIIAIVWNVMRHRG